MPPAKAAKKGARNPGLIYGVGVDLLRLERMEKAYRKHGQRLINKILGPAEQEQFAARVRRRASRQSGSIYRTEFSVAARALAMAFAAKEAAVKALGTGFHGVGYRDTGVVHEPSGKPVLVFSERLQARMKKLGIAGGHVSLTDEGGMICAFVVLERGR